MVPPFARATTKRRVQRAEYEAKAKAEKDATATLLADPVATKTEIEKRLRSWIELRAIFICLKCSRLRAGT